MVENHIVKLSVPRIERFMWPKKCWVAGVMPLMSMKPAISRKLMRERQNTISKVPTASEESFTKALITAKKKAATSIQHDCSMRRSPKKESRKL